MNDKRRYCGPLGITFGDLIRKAGDVQARYHGNNRYIYHTHKGRCGLGLLCRHWKLKSGDEILVPAYNCGTEVDPFIHYGLSVVFYRVDLNAAVDLNDIYTRITQKTKIVYVTHYFGWPQDIKALSEHCRKNSSDRRLCVVAFQ